MSNEKLKPRNILRFTLKIIARRIISRYKPIVIGITGSVGKTTAKEAIFSVLSRKFSVWKNDENFNNEIGVPLAVLGIKPPKPHVTGRAWKMKLVWEIIKSKWLAYGFPKSKYPAMLVLELAADRPGDIRYLAGIVKPAVGVVTALGEVPVHVEFYASPKEVAAEKRILIESLPAHDGLAVLNYDDQTVLEMKEVSKAQTETFGFSEQADYRVSNISYVVSDDGRSIGGMSFKVHQGSMFVPFRVNNLVGVHQIYGILAAVAVGAHFGVNLVEMASILENFQPPQNRMSLVKGMKDTIIINDVYNASPASTHAALDTLRDFGNNVIKLHRKGRKIAVLGDMKELGQYSVQAHQTIGNLAGERCDILVTVGAEAKFIADSAANQMPREKILSFENSDKAKTSVKDLIQEGDVILIKGSRSMKMEVILEEIAAQ